MVATQRETGYAGGIQSGSTAASTQSAALETALRASAERAREKFPSLTWRRGYTGAELAAKLGTPRAQLRGFLPDGGIWLSGPGATPLVVLEAKRQGATGNAIERWFKNHSVFRALAGVLYVTFCSGEGFFDENPPQRTLETALALDPSERSRLAAGKVWNTQSGRIWLYRYRNFTPADAVSLDAVVTASISRAQKIARASHTH